MLPPSLKRILKALETRNLIVVSKDPADRQHTPVQLSDEGKALIRSASKDSVAIYNEIESLLGHDGIQAFLNELEFVLDTLSNRLSVENGEVQ